MTAIAERMRSLKRRLGAHGDESTKDDKAQRALRRAEAKALRLENHRKGPSPTGRKDWQ